MAQYRTAQGKTLDMGVFSAQNERVRAVGNMKVNARGDIIDSQGRVVQSINDKINDYYNATVTNPGATNAFASMPSNATHNPQASASRLAPSAPKVIQEELSAEELQLQESLDGDLDEEVRLEEQKTRTIKGKK